MVPPIERFALARPDLVVVEPARISAFAVLVMRWWPWPGCGV